MLIRVAKSGERNWILCLTKLARDSAPASMSVTMSCIVECELCGFVWCDLI